MNRAEKNSTKESSKSGPKRMPFEVTRDRMEISQLYLQGKTQYEIAGLLAKDPQRKYTLTQQSISRDVRAIQQRWLQESLTNFDQAKARELAKIDTLEREYWRAWERSKMELKKTKSEKVEGKQPRQKGEITKEELLGDHRYLVGVQWCIDRRCQLLGLDAPKRLSVDSNILDQIKWEGLTTNQIRRLADGEEPNKVIPGFRLN